MTGTIYLAVGMPRAGSGWHYNLMHELALAGGAQDARQVRRRYHLERILTEVNCNIGALTPARLLPALIPALAGHSFVIKAHAGPKPLALRLLQRGLLKASYIYRDPRDALLSAYEYGQRKRERGNTGAFSELISLDIAIDFMQPYLAISEAWLACPQALPVRYETLLAEYENEAGRLVAFLGLEADAPAVQAAIERYRPDQGNAERRGTHFVKGQVGRYRQKLSPAQQQRCLESFGHYLAARGYPIP